MKKGLRRKSFSLLEHGRQFPVGIHDLMKKGLRRRARQEMMTDSSSCRNP